MDKDVRVLLCFENIILIIYVIKLKICNLKVVKFYNIKL